MLRCFSIDVLLQEVPNEISLSFGISGCPHNCPGCSWSNIPQNQGFNLTTDVLLLNLARYKGLISCVLFLGGEWDEHLLTLLTLCKKEKLLTCLYTGKETISDDMLSLLDYVKLGPYIKELGGLDSPITNQRFLNLHTNEDMNHWFRNNK